MTYTHRIKNGVRVELTAQEISELENKDIKFENNKFDKALNNLRITRNNLLKQTDFYALSDVTMSEDMTSYRQNLRDITNGLTTVEEIETVEFPTKP
tara:strand:- start:51 stop:341 length:291 start_codon:yes stop_codon:yes gene_type:complete